MQLLSWGTLKCIEFKSAEMWETFAKTGNVGLLIQAFLAPVHGHTCACRCSNGEGQHICNRKLRQLLAAHRSRRVWTSAPVPLKRLKLELQQRGCQEVNSS